MGETISPADMAIFLFIRQFSMVDQNWFNNSPYPKTSNWFTSLPDLPLLARVMAKTPASIK